jgi:hypothetical protein
MHIHAACVDYCVCHVAVARDHDITLEKKARQRQLLDAQVAEKKAAANAEKQEEAKVHMPADGCEACMDDVRDDVS